MNRSTFIWQVVGAGVLQAIPASVIPKDRKHIQDKPARMNDILITPEGEAYIVQAITFNHVHAQIIDGDGKISLSKRDAARMVCHDWDDLDC
jgi:hypothetical protein